jgi:hypothetical protein
MQSYEDLRISINEKINGVYMNGRLFKDNVDCLSNNKMKNIETNHDCLCIYKIRNTQLLNIVLRV